MRPRQQIVVAVLRSQAKLIRIPLHSLSLSHFETRIIKSTTQQQPETNIMAQTTSISHSAILSRGNASRRVASLQQPGFRLALPALPNRSVRRSNLTVRAETQTKEDAAAIKEVLFSFTLSNYCAHSRINLCCTYRR